jgi:hypothetical protein
MAGRLKTPYRRVKMLFNPLLVTNYFCWRAVIKDEEGNRKIQFTRSGDRRIRELATHFLLRETLLVVHCVFHSGEIDWSKSASEVVNLIRALAPPPPMAHTFAGDGMPVREAEASGAARLARPPPSVRPTGPRRRA